MATNALPDFGDWAAKQSTAETPKPKPSTGALPHFGDWAEKRTAAPRQPGASDSWAMTPGERVKSIFTGPGTLAAKPSLTAPAINFGNLLQDTPQPTSAPEKIARGVTEGVLDTASGLTNPLNALFAIATGGASVIEKKLGTEALTRLISAGFSADMIYNAGRQAPQLWDQIKAGDWQGASKTITSMTAGTAMGVAAGRHAVRGSARSAAAPGADRRFTSEASQAEPANAPPASSETPPTTPGSSPAEPPRENLQPNAATLPDFGEWAEKRETPEPAPKPKKLTKAEADQQAGAILARWETGDAALSEDERGILRDHLARSQGGASYEKLNAGQQGKVNDLIEVLHKQYRDRQAAPAEVPKGASSEVQPSAPAETPGPQPVTAEAPKTAAPDATPVSQVMPEWFTPAIREESNGDTVVRGIRWQRSPGAPEVNPEGATHFSVANPAALDNAKNLYAGQPDDLANAGGREPVAGEIRFRKPLLLDAKPYSKTNAFSPPLGEQVIDRLAAPEVNLRIDDLDKLDGEALEDELKIPRGTVARGMKSPHDRSGAVRDAIAAALLRRDGYDGAIGVPQHEGVLAEAVRLSPAGSAQPVQGKRGRLSPDVYEKPLAELSVDPTRLQYKSEAGEGGAGEELRSIKKYDRLRGGVLAVWTDPATGRDLVVNGHNRYAAAKRLGETTHPVRYIDAATAEEARLVGALMNIGEGRGTAIDAAKVFRDGAFTPKDLEDEGISLTGEKARQGLALSKLAPSIFDRVVQGDLPVERAALIGESLGEYDEQTAALELLDKAAARGKRLSNSEASELIRFVKGAPRPEQQTENLSLFGEDVVKKSLALEKAQISSYIKQQLGKERRLFTVTGTAGAAERLGKAGNVIKAEENARIAQDAARAQALYDKLSMSSGPIADALNQGAEELAQGQKSEAQVKADAYERVRQAISESDTFGGSPKAGTAGSPEASDSRAGVSGAAEPEPEPGDQPEPERPEPKVSPQAKRPRRGGLPQTPEAPAELQQAIADPRVQAESFADRMKAMPTAQEGRALFPEIESKINELQRGLGLEPTVGKITPTYQRGFSTVNPKEWAKAIKEARAIDPAKAQELKALIDDGAAAHKAWEPLYKKEQQQQDDDFRDSLKQEQAPEEQTSIVSPEEEASSRDIAKEDQGQLDAQRVSQEIQFGKGKQLDAGKESIEDSPLFGGPRQGGLDLGAGLGAGQKYVDSFWQRDLQPALAGFVKGTHETADLLARWIAPRRAGFWRAKTPEKGVTALYRMKGGHDEANALLDRQLEAWRSELRRLTPQQKVEYVDAIKRGKPIANSSLDALRIFMRKADDYLHEEISKHRSLNYIADHWRVMYRTPPAWEDAATHKPIDRATQNLGRRPMRGSLGFTKQHFLDDWTEGLTWRVAGPTLAEMQRSAGEGGLKTGQILFRQGAKGLEAIPFDEKARDWLVRQERKGLLVRQRGGDPQSWDPIEMYQEHYADTTKYIYAQRAHDEIGRLGMRKFKRQGAPDIPGFTPLADAITKRYMPPPGPRAQLGEWVYEENIARMLNNHLGVDLIRKYGVGRMVMGAKNWTTSIELSLSPFHLVFEGNELVGSAIGLGGRQLVLAAGKALVERDFKTAARLAGSGLHELATAPLQAIPGIRGEWAQKIPGLRETADQTGATARQYFKEVGPSAFRTRELSAEESDLTNRLQQMRANNPAYAPTQTRLANVQADLAAARGDFQAATARFTASATGKSLLDRFPDLHEGIHDYFQGGGRMSMHEDYRINAQKGLAQAALDEWHAGNAIGASAVRSLPALNELIMKPMFDVYIPNIKIATFLKERHQILLENEGKLRRGEVTKDELMRRTVDFVEHRFGEMNWDNFWWNRTLKSIAQLNFRSTTWKAGNLMASGGAVLGVPKTAIEGVRSLKQGEAPALNPNLAWALGMSLWTAALGTLISKGIGGVDPKSFKDLVYPLVYDNIRVSLPTYWRDWLHLQHSPGGYLKSGETGEIGRVIDLFENRDFYGTEVYSPDDPLGQRVFEGAKHLVPIPFSVSSARAMKEQGAPEGIQKLGYLGFTKAPAYIEQSDAMQLALEYNRQNIPQGSRTSAQADHSRTVRMLTKGLRAGRDVSGQIEDLYQAGKLSDTDLSRIQRESGMTDLETAITPLSIDKAVRVYQAATPQEQEELSDILTGKIDRAVTRNPAQFTPQLWQKLVELGFIDPSAAAPQK